MDLGMEVSPNPTIPAKMMYVLALLFVASATAASIDEELARISMQNPDLFQGDILGIDPEDRNVIPYTQMRWPGGRVPYVIDRSLLGHKLTIENAMQDYHTRTCVRFVPRTIERNYIKIFNGDGCYSYVGMVNRGEQPLSLKHPGCIFRGTIVHELGHALGFFHEQNRSDRDKYLIVYWQNIQKGMETQFALLQPHQNLLLTPFDHQSIMLYGNYAFSKDGRSKTMVARNGQPLNEPYTKQGMTNSDVTRIKKMYC